MKKRRTPTVSLVLCKTVVIHQTVGRSLAVAPPRPPPPPIPRPSESPRSTHVFAPGVFTSLPCSEAIPHRRGGDKCHLRRQMSGSREYSGRRRGHDAALICVFQRGVVSAPPPDSLRHSQRCLFVVFVACWATLKRVECFTGTIEERRCFWC